MSTPVRGIGRWIHCCARGSYHRFLCEMRNGPPRGTVPDFETPPLCLPHRPSSTLIRHARCNTKHDYRWKDCLCIGPIDDSVSTIVGQINFHCYHQIKEAYMSWTMNSTLAKLHPTVMHRTAGGGYIQLIRIEHDPFAMKSGLSPLGIERLLPSRSLTGTATAES